ncbi:hypothetical protein D046_0713B, partial [Vibrio parahaemolyticus V-223/04]
TMMKLTG